MMDSSTYKKIRYTFIIFYSVDVGATTIYMQDVRFLFINASDFIFHIFS